jgi:hypothetical protein
MSTSSPQLVSVKLAVNAIIIVMAKLKIVKCFFMVVFVLMN